MEEPGCTEESHSSDIVSNRGGRGDNNICTVLEHLLIYHHVLQNCLFLEIPKKCFYEPVQCRLWRRPEVCKNWIQDLSSKLSCWTDWWKTHSRQIGADEWTGATADGKSTITTSKYYYWMIDNHDDYCFYGCHILHLKNISTHRLVLILFYNLWPPLYKCPVRQ